MDRNTLRLTALVIYCVIFIVGILGNGLVIYVTGFRMKRTVNSVCFLNLALADFLFTTFLIFTIISTSMNHHWQFGLFMCRLNSLVSVVNMFASIFLLTAISLDRCLSIWVVVWAQNKRTVLKAQIASVAIWVAALVCSTPYVAFRDLIEANNKTYCAQSPSITNKQEKILKMFRFVVGFLVPFLMISVCYLAIGIRVRRLQRARKKKSHKIIFSVIFAFFICWLPFHVIQLMGLHLNTNPNLRIIIQSAGPLTICLGYMNSCLNPILYVFMCDEFQRKLKQSICFVLESALAEDHLSFMSTRSLASHFSRSTHKSESGPSPEGKGKATTFTFTESKTVFVEEKERDTLSTD